MILISRSIQNLLRFCGTFRTPCILLILHKAIGTQPLRFNMSYSYNFESFFYNKGTNRICKETVQYYSQYYFYYNYGTRVCKKIINQSNLLYQYQDLEGLHQTLSSPTG